MITLETLKEYPSSLAFWNEVSPYLLNHETENNLCLGLAFTFKTDPKNCNYQSALFDGENFLGSLIASQYHSHIKLLPSSYMDFNTAQKLLDNYYGKKSVDFHGVVAEKTTALIFSEILENKGINTKICMEQGIYRCQKVFFPTIAKSLNFRAATPKDAETIGTWINQFHQEAVPHDPPINGLEEAQKRINQKMIYILEQNKTLVSMAAWTRDIGSSCSVNLVYTPKSLRKQGYASVVTALLTQHLLDQGKKEIHLYTDLKNPTSNKIYRDIGYEYVCDSLHLAVCIKY